MALSLINTIVLIPFAARLFAAVSVKVDRLAPFILSTAYDSSAIVPSVGFAVILSTVTATQFYGGTWPLRTDGTYAFPAFNISTTVLAGVNISQWSLNISGYSANL